MLYLEKSGLRHPGHKGGLMRNTLVGPPHKLPPLKALGQPHPLLCGDLGAVWAAGSPAMAEVSLASAEMMSSRPSQKAGGMFLTFGCSQQQKSNCPDAHHLQKFRHSSSPSTTRVMSKDSAIQGSMPCLLASQLWEDLPCWMFQIFLLPGSSAWAIFLYSSLITGTLLQRKSR